VNYNKNTRHDKTAEYTVSVYNKVNYKLIGLIIINDNFEYSQKNYNNTMWTRKKI
jgi:hypothetical protein